MSDEFVKKVTAAFTSGNYADVIYERGAQTSNSHEFRQKAYSEYLPH